MRHVYFPQNDNFSPKDNMLGKYLVSPALLAALLSLLSVPQLAVAEDAILLTEDLTSLEIGDKIHLLEDPRSKLVIRDVALGPRANEFKKSDTRKPSF